MDSLKRYGLLFGLFMVLAIPCFALSGSGGGGTSFNAAVPGAIGGTTSSTGQFTKLAVGTSVPALPTNVGESAFNSSASGTEQLFITDAGGGSGFVGIGIGTSEPIITTYSLLGDGTNTYINAPSASLFLREANATKVTIGANGTALGTDNAVNTMARITTPSFIDATAATTTIPYGCTLLTKAVIFENVQFTVNSVTQSVAPSLSLCDTGTAANPSACGTTIVNSGTFTAAGNISQTTMTNANVAAGHFVCTFFAAGTATVVIAQATGTARPQ